jgi:FSR family fosmidomycin resistance protein-like MFS transporter
MKTKPSLRNPFQTANVITLTITHLLHDIYSSFLAPILPLLIDKLGMSFSQAGFLSVAQRLPSLLNPFVGLIADKVSVRYCIIIAPSLTAISMSLLGIAPNYTVLVFLLSIMGISAILFHVPAPVMMRRISGDRVGLGMSFFMFGGEAARTIGPLVILGAVSLWGLEGTYYLIPIGVACTVILYFRIRKIRISDQFKRQSSDASLKQTLRIATPTFMALAGYTFFRSGMRSGLTLFLPVYLSEQGASLWIAGISLSIIQLTGIVGSMLAGNISDKIGRRRILMITAVASPALMWVFLEANSIFLVPLLLAMGLFLLAPMPVMLAVANEIKTDHPSFVNGVYMMINFIINSLAMMWLGYLADTIGMDLTYRLSAILALGAIPVALKFSTKMDR